MYTSARCAPRLLRRLYLIRAGPGRAATIRTGPGVPCSHGRPDHSVTHPTRSLSNGAGSRAGRDSAVTPPSPPSAVNLANHMSSFHRTIRIVVTNEQASRRSHAARLTRWPSGRWLLLPRHRHRHRLALRRGRAHSFRALFAVLFLRPLCDPHGTHRTHT